MLENILFSTGSDNFISGLGIAVSGLVIVFVVLVLICGILYLFSRMFYKKPEAASAPAAEEAVQEPAVEEETVEIEDEAELVAAITAAVACCLGRSTDGLVVRSFRRIGRKRGR